MPLNYGRWNDLEDSSSDSDSDATPPPTEEEFFRTLALSSAQPKSVTTSMPSPFTVPRARGGGTSRRKPLFVKLHPSDDGEGLVDAFYEHPDNFHKYVSPKGHIESWGLFPYIPAGQPGEGGQDFGPMEKMTRKMNTQIIYAGGGPRRPENQFVDWLIEKKKAALSAMDLGDLEKRDFVLRIHMTDLPNDNGGDRIWRTFRVSGGLKLGVFGDKVVRPLMGWTRNLHAHVFTDFRDGALFGPTNCGAVDVVHIDMVGYGYVPEEKWSIAHILQNVGDCMGLFYDFGDHWYHEITLQEICSLEESTGAITVLNGSGACPRENGNGNHTWGPDIETLKNGSRRDREKLLDEILSSVNYKERGWTSRKAFNIDKFDVADAQAAVRKAIDSKSSVAHGAKSFIMPISPGGSHTTHFLKKKEKLQQTYDPESPHGYFQEVLSDRRDGVNKTACANCGSPHELRLCKGCRQRYYCSVECQRTHWRAKHKAECSNNK